MKRQGFPTFVTREYAPQRGASDETLSLPGDMIAFATAVNYSHFAKQGHGYFSPSKRKDVLHA
jgi:hypothetical protein